MAEKKKEKATKPPAARVEQTEEGVQITRPGRVLRDEGRELAVYRRHTPPVRCPYCKEEEREGRCERITGASPGITYYRCLVCCDPDDGSPTTFKVLTTASGD